MRGGRSCTALRILLVLICAVPALSIAGDLYSELEIEPTATAKEIRAAYRRLALKFHPDKASSGDKGRSEFQDNTARFIRISEAYETLSDPTKRRHYDATYASGARHSGRASSGAQRNYEFTFSLKDAFEVLERLMGKSMPEGLRSKYQLAKTALAMWPGFSTPLPELLESGALAAALKLVDWGAIGTAAKDTLARAFEKEDGSIDWLKVGAAGAAAVTAVTAALDTTDDGNRTATMFSLGSQAVSWLQGVMGSGGNTDDNHEEV